MAAHDLILSWMLEPLANPILVLLLAILRVLGAVALALAGHASRRSPGPWHELLSFSFYSLAVLQLLGAMAMELPTAPQPSRWIFAFNFAVLGIGLGYYLRYVHHSRKS